MQHVVRRRIVWRDFAIGIRRVGSIARLHGFIQREGDASDRFKAHRGQRCPVVIGGGGGAHPSDKADVEVNHLSLRHWLPDS